MMSARSQRRPPPIARTLSWAFAASLALHGAGFLSFRGLGRLPALELAIVKPSEAEFGVLEPPPKAAEPAPPTAAAAAGDKPAARPERSERPADKPRKPSTSKNAFPDAGDAGRFAPAGSQIALRADVERIEAGPLAEEVRAIVSALPDVRWLLAGSGVDPLRDLARLFVATPDLRREHVVLAGRYRGDGSVARDAVRRLAESHGRTAPWRTRHGITVAPWFNQPASPHVLALLGRDAFAITREVDLPRVLAVARTLHPGAGHASNALVHMAERELLHLSVEHARNFTRGPRTAYVPDRLAISVRAEPQSKPSFQIDVNAQFPDAAQARTAFQYWDELRERYANHALLALFGVGSLLRAARLSQDGERMSLQLQVSVNEARMLLRWARDSLHPHVAAAGD